ncbi:MAG: hypothetical protein H0X51_08750 [Parachlamydiaceae bacterium]|nr:hypothetical protein [Parachlamydiaceae bacterium]
MINQIIKSMLLLATGLAFWNIGILAGAFWAATNLYLIGKVLEMLLIEKRTGWILLGIKFPVLYGLGYFLLNLVDPLYATVGFSLLLPVAGTHAWWWSQEQAV